MRHLVGHSLNTLNDLAESINTARRLRKSRRHFDFSIFYITSIVTVSKTFSQSLVLSISKPLT